MSENQKTLLKERSPSQYVKLNVGGTLFYTTIGTLTRSDNMLRTMFSGLMEVHTDSEDWVLIDRCGKHFGTILNYLRDGTVALPDNNREIMELLAEAKYFLIEELTESCLHALAQKEKNSKKRENEKKTEAICRGYLITSAIEEQQLLKYTSYPVVKFVVGNEVNKNTNSRFNLLQNMKLFDSLALLYIGKVVFLKDYNNISKLITACCSWTFYRHGEVVNTVSSVSKYYDEHVINFLEARVLESIIRITL